jgi:hypothetical protein
VRAYGPAFLEEVRALEDENRIIPVSLNEDFFAGVLGGDSRMGHHVVFCAHEETFYFYDSELRLMPPPQKQSSSSC